MTKNMKSGFKIEKSVPVPGPTAGRAGKYPWAEMKTGDSVVIKTSVQSARCAAFSYGTRHGKKFTTRLTKDGVRIWRVK